MDKREIAEVLEDIAFLLEVAGESPFKSRAYASAARTVQALDRDLGELIASGELRNLKGIGAALAGKIAVLAAGQPLAYYEELKARVPAGLLDLLRVPGLGPKRVREVHAALGIASLAELEYAAESRALEGLPGFGEKLQTRVLEGIAALKRRGARFLLSDGLAQAEAVLAALAAHPGVRRASAAGSLRRLAETVGGVDLVAEATDAPAALDAFAELEMIAAVVERSDCSCRVRLEEGVHVTLHVVSAAEYPFVLRYRTGSREHNEALRAHAAAHGLRLEETGLWRGATSVDCADEAGIYAALGLAEIPPELREDRGEIAAAAAGALPRLVESNDLEGLLHVHSTWSDGRNTLREMALAARERGYRYLGLTDHSQGARYAHGLLADDLRRQHEEIDRLNAELDGFRILKGTECDILPDGRLDYPDEVLAQFELVVGSVHSRFAMTRPEMTERVLRALASPYLDVLGHPTGRLLLGRDGYAIDLAAVCAAAAERGVAVEINANPHRLDLDWREVRAFQERGGWVSIDPDAHRIEGLDDVHFGVACARKGWATRARVLNALPLGALLEWLGRRRAGGGPRAESTAQPGGAAT